LVLKTFWKVLGVPTSLLCRYHIPLDAASRKKKDKKSLKERM